MMLHGFTSFPAAFGGLAQLRLGEPEAVPLSRYTF